MAEIIAALGNKLIKVGEKLGLYPSCCCCEYKKCGVCCPSYSNCYIEYRATLSNNDTIDGAGNLNIGGDPNIEAVTGGGFSAVAFNDGSQCFLSISWGTEVMCPDTFDIVSYNIGLLYTISCDSCCDLSAGARNCSLSLQTSGVTIEPQCAIQVTPGEPYVTNIELLSFNCNQPDC